MTTTTVNGLPVISARISMPRVGAWVAELSVGGEHELALAGVVTIDLHGWRFRGTALRARQYEGETQLVVVGGRGGFRSELGPKFYLGSPLSLPLGDVLSAAGELLSPASDPDLLSTHLARWTRAAGTAGDALVALVEHVGAVWRVLSDGTVWVGSESWPLATPATKIDEDQANASAVFADAPELRPGSSIEGRRVSHVEHELGPSGLRTRVLFESTSEPWTRLRGAFEALAGRAVAPTRYLGQYAGRVVKVDSSGRLEVKLDDPALPGLTSVSIVHGLPGVGAVEGVAGRRLRVAFANGDPELPFAVGWESGGTAKIGTLLLVQNAQSMALLPPQWFAAGSAGNAAATAAQAAAALSGNVAYLVPVTIPTVEV